MNNVLKDKIAWITGGASGIGLNLTMELLKKGAYVFASGRRELNELISQNPEFSKIVSNHNFFYLKCDVSKEEEVQNTYKRIVKSKNSPDILINNSGIGIFKSFVKLTTEEFDLMMNVNYKGAFLCTKSVITDMIEKESGFIVNINSVASLDRFTNSSAYAGSKSALLAMSRVLREEVRKDNIKILDVFPGATATPIWNPKVLENHSSKMMNPSDIAIAIVSSIENSINNNMMIEELVLKPQQGNL